MSKYRGELVKNDKNRSSARRWPIIKFPFRAGVETVTSVNVTSENAQNIMELQQQSVSAQKHECFFIIQSAVFCKRTCLPVHSNTVSYDCPEFRMVTVSVIECHSNQRTSNRHREYGRNQNPFLATEQHFTRSKLKCDS